MIIQCDFDSTIISNNLSILLRTKFAGDGWQNVEDDYIKGLITVEQSNMRQYKDVKEPKERLREFVRHHIRVRPGFPEFVRYCRENDTPLVIVSSGLDFYIETVFAGIGIPDLELYCGSTSFTPDSGIAVTYRDPDGNLIDAGFKKKYLSWLQQRDPELVYIGDGLSDLEAARLADHVFATGNLLKLLKDESVACRTFTDFNDLLRQVRALK